MLREEFGVTNTTVLKFKSYYDKGDSDFLILALIEEDGIFYVVHKFVREAYTTQKRVRELLHLGVRFETPDFILSNVYPFQSKQSAEWHYTQSLG